MENEKIYTKNHIAQELFNMAEQVITANEPELDMLARRIAILIQIYSIVPDFLK